MSHRGAGATGDVLTDTVLGGDMQFSPLFRSIRDALIIADTSTYRIVSWNPSAERLFGCTMEEARVLTFDAMFPAGASDDAMTFLRDYFEHIRAFDADPLLPLELAVLHKSGAEMVVEMTMTPIPGPETTYVILIVRDCTDRNLLQRDLAELLQMAQEHSARVAELGRLKADFTAMVAHELGTPVASIRAMAEMLEYEGLADAQRRQIRASLRTEAEMIQRLVDDIREASRFEKDDFEVELRPVPVASILAEAASGGEVALDHHVFSVAPAPAVSVRADRARIGQILRNMLNNAAKYTPPGTRVELRARQVDGRVRFEVEDHGPGIHPEDLSEIFDKFVRGRDASGTRKPGAGLGLYLSRRIAQAHGTDLRVASTPGAGSTFAFELEVTE
jgi:PAS domain S-box-containing protein